MVLGKYVYALGLYPRLVITNFLLNISACTRHLIIENSAKRYLETTTCSMKKYMEAYQRLWTQCVKGECCAVDIAGEVNKKICISLYYGISNYANRSRS